MKLELPGWSDARVLVIGDVMLDRYWHGGTSRISPEAPVPVVHVSQTEERVGGAGNVALNIAALGGKARVLGITGHDDAAKAIEGKLADAGVGTVLRAHAGYPTITKLRIISRHQQLIRLDFEAGFPREAAADLVEQMRQQVSDVDAVILSDYGKGALQYANELIKVAREADKPVLVDPKGNNFGIYRGATLITPNLSEFEGVVGKCHSLDELVEKGSELLVDCMLQALMVTRGEQGMTLLQRDKDPVHLDAQAKEVFDVTGAGDTVISVMGASLAAGADLEKAMVLANTAAGIVVGKLGTATVSVAELRRALHEQASWSSGIVTENQLADIVADMRAHGETVVMTNGCFDILHPGHVQYLEQARNLGDRLIVAVNDDASVGRLKGEQRPINSLEHRMTVLSALESVDWVVPFTEDTPERVICRLLPDVLVKGGDYQAHEVAGGGCVEEHGGKVVILNFKEGYSTSDVIEKIKGSSE